MNAQFRLVFLVALILWGDHVHRADTRQVLPRLNELGASDADIHQIMVDNPRRFFEDN